MFERTTSVEIGSLLKGRHVQSADSGSASRGVNKARSHFDDPRGELTCRVLAMPADSNPSGDIFGGWIMSQMDAAGLIVATRYAEHRAVTVAVTNLAFHSSVQVGDVVCCFTHVQRIGKTSITLDIEVWSLRGRLEHRRKAAAATFVFVAVDCRNKPHPIQASDLNSAAHDKRERSVQTPFVSVFERKPTAEVGMRPEPPQFASSIRHWFRRNRLVSPS